MCPFCIASAIWAVGGVAAGGGLTVLAGKLLQPCGRRETEAVTAPDVLTQVERLGQAAKAR